MADTNEQTAGDRIRQWLRENPEHAHDIAFAAICGLYLEEDQETALPEHNSYPRDSGSDYVDEVGNALESAGIMPLIEELQAEVPDEEEEDDDD